MAFGKGRGNMSLSMKFIRLLIVLLNLAFVIVGIALIVIGIYVMKDSKLQQIRPLLSPDLTSKYSPSLSNIEIFAIILIVIGGVLLAIGFLGCCGAIKGFRVLHVFYAIIIGGIILAEIAIIIVYVINHNRFKSEFVHNLQESIVKYYVGMPMNNSIAMNSISLSWDLTQFNLQCCGAVNKDDYLHTRNWNRTDPYDPDTNLTVPFTCCPMNATRNWNGLPINMTEATTCAVTGINAYSQGCYDRLMGLLSTYKKYVIIGGIIAGVVEILAFLFTILLYCRRKDYNSV